MNVAIVVLTALDAAPVDEITERTPRMWRARFAAGPVGDFKADQKKCPVTGAKTAGEAIAALIERADLRGELDSIELQRETETIALIWRPERIEQRISDDDAPAPPDRRSMFHPYANGRAYRKAVTDSLDRRRHTASLDSSVFTQIAALIQGEAGDAP